MKSKILELKNNTNQMIKESLLRIAELNNIITIINLYLSTTGNINNYEVEILKKRIETLKSKPDYAGKHEHQKTKLIKFILHNYVAK